jgi:uncharacterized protein YegJ (DUF2314 family)
MSEQQKRELIAMALLLRGPRLFDVQVAQRAANFAFRDAPEPPQVVPLKNPSTMGLKLGPMRLGIINKEQPYFADIAKVADQIPNFLARKAVQEHNAWLSVDLIGDPPPIMPERVYAIIGRLIAELLSDDVLGIMRLPKGPIIGYDTSFIPLFRNGRALEAFQKGVPDRTTSAKGKDSELAEATAEARRRWAEFVGAFTNRQPGQGFAVKKKFTDGEKVEHMWVSVTAIRNGQIEGCLANDPNIIKSMKAKDPISMSAEEIEDWIYTNGKVNVGAFQAKVLRPSDNK